jgi:hypothetical protein
VRKLRTLVALAMVACGSRPMQPTPPVATGSIPSVDKLEPPLRDQYTAWLDRQSERDHATAKRTVERWECKAASYDETRGVSRCADEAPPSDAEYAELEIARLVVDPHVDIEVWMASEDSALALEPAGFHLWSSTRAPKLQPIHALDLHRTVYAIHILPIDLHALDRLLASPAVISIRRTTVADVEHVHVRPM